MILDGLLQEVFALSDKSMENLRRATAANLIVNLVIFASLFLVVVFVSDLIGGNPMDLDLNLYIYVILGFALMLILYIARRYEFDCSFFKTYAESKAVRVGMAEKIRHLPLSFFAKKDPTDITVRIMGDVGMQETMLSHWLPALYAALIYVPLVSVVILLWSPLVGLAIVWPIPIVYLVVFISFRVQKDSAKKKFDDHESVTEMIQETLECSQDIKANNAQKNYESRIFEELDELEDSEIKLELSTSLFLSLGHLVLKLGLVTTALASILLFIDGTISLVILVVALIIASRIYDPINVSINYLYAITNVRFNCERIKEIEDLQVQGGDAEPKFDNFDIVFRNVGFSYKEGQQVLKDVSFTAKQGEITALIGPSGGGKSTVARLCTRFWDIDTGSITLGGKDISEIDPEVLLKNYSIVFQDVVLFNDTVMNNIRIGRKDASDEDVMRAAKLANCDEFVTHLPNGYNSVIGENGGKLSGGERQRISIARAILKNAPIVIMDEATASLDAESERMVQQALSRLVVGKTVLIIAHRMRTVREADKIVVLKEGYVAESGSPEELLKTDGIFAHMMSLQTASSTWSLN